MVVGAVRRLHTRSSQKRDTQGQDFPLLRFVCVQSVQRRDNAVTADSTSRKVWADVGRSLDANTAPIIQHPCRQNPLDEPNSRLAAAGEVQ
jgi:hypothetical protein